MVVCVLLLRDWKSILNEPRHEKTCLRDLWLCKTQTSLLSYTNKHHEIAKKETGDIILSRQWTTKVLITAQMRRLITAWMRRLICAFVVRIWQERVFSWCCSNKRIREWDLGENIHRVISKSTFLYTKSEPIISFQQRFWWNNCYSPAHRHHLIPNRGSSCLV